MLYFYSKIHNYFFDCFDIQSFSENLVGFVLLPPFSHFYWKYYESFELFEKDLIEDFVSLPSFYEIINNLVILKKFTFG